MNKKLIETEFLKECLADALIELMTRKKFENIRIIEITKLAGVARSTYYRNFDSKEEILQFKLGLLTERWQNKKETKDIEDTMQAIIAFVEFISSNRILITSLYNSNLMHVFQNYFYRILGPQKNEKGEDAYLKAFVSFGMFGLINEWIRNGMIETPEQLGKIFDGKIAT
ncbi:TetR/AcrR family transcriptional regulator [Lactiplantibacillus plantarum]|uniref:TetR/AcrR family transcriptional regulator n=1 Tax=Lactiplantibacillus plantarum TaxID=1590 RepID=UPI000975EA31|nr:TetR/AcrR family transcriptional regulator [Lactiplantibacillus plantarum]TLQ21500.1 TetR/AcrR family transcriptional regulator [Lactiplantibacillus plantarum]